MSWIKTRILCLDAVDEEEGLMEIMKQRHVEVRRIGP